MKTMFNVLSVVHGMIEGATGYDAFEREYLRYSQHGYDLRGFP